MIRLYLSLALSLCLLFGLTLIAAIGLGKWLRLWQPYSIGDVVYRLRSPNYPDFTDIYAIDQVYHITVFLTRVRGYPLEPYLADGWNELVGFSVCTPNCDIMVLDGRSVYNLTNTPTINEIFSQWDRQGGLVFMQYNDCVSLRECEHPGEYIYLTETPPLNEPLP
jgi:hypothetical protein